VVVEAEFNGATKTTLRSERGTALKKGRIRSKREEKRLDTVGIVRDVRLHTIMGFLAKPEYGGNYNQSGWKVIGFEDQMTYKPPFGYYDAEESKHE